MQCYECKKQIQGEKIRYNNHWYHDDCQKIAEQRDKFNKFVCGLFGIKSPGSKIWSQRKKLIQCGLNDQQIINTLNYIYSVKKVPKPKQAGIGLVDKYCKQAIEYFQHQSIKKQIMAKQAEQTLRKQEQQRIVIHVNHTQSRQIKVLSDFVQPQKGDN